MTKMRAIAFHSIINSESSTLDFLQKYELMPNTDNLPGCVKCSSTSCIQDQYTNLMIFFLSIS